MKNFIINKFFIHFACLFSIIIFFTEKLNAQSGNCDSNTPYYFVDLSSSADSIWISPLAVRDGNCCGTTHPDRCIEFYITMNPGTIAIRFNINSGAIPSGSMYYQINCGPQIPVGDAVCLQAPGPYTLTFCKPGGNENTYKIEAIPTPNADFFFADVDGYCNIQLNVVGLDPATVQWTDITYDGFYDSYLSCTNCLNPIVNFTPDHPSFVDYQVCGEVLTPECTISLEFCDTVRVYFYDQLNLTLDGDTTYLCEGDSAISLIPIVNGGLPPYQFYWYLDGNILSNDSIFEASESGTYILEVRDSTYPSCSPILDTITVIKRNNPNIYILPSQAGLCFGNNVELTAYGAQTYIWTPSDGLSSVYGSVVIANPAITTLYDVIGIDEYGCRDTANVFVEIFPLPNVDAGQDQNICLGDSTQLNGSGAWIYEWTPINNLSNPHISNPIAYPDITTTYYLIGKSLGSNVIINGDFENGNVGFTTEYNYNINLVPEGNYYITNNPHNCHNDFAQCEDHTPYPGKKMMVINGAPTPGQKIWCQNVPVTPYSEYAFSAWLTSVHPLNPAVLQFSVNDILLGSPFEAPTTTCNWVQFYEIWYSNFNTNAEICIVNQTLIQNGNDFAIDDIYFAPLCDNIDSVTIFVCPNPIINISHNDTSLCYSDSLILLLNSNIPNTTFNWSNSLGTNPTVTVSPTSTTTYSVTGTTAEGCTGIAEVTVTVHPLPTITATATPNEICFGASTELTASSDITGTIFNWSDGLGSSLTVTVSPTATTTYSVTGTTLEGCTGTAEVTVTVHPLPTTTASATPNEICFGASTELTASSDITRTTFNWSNSLGTNPTVTVSPTSTTTYTVTGTTLAGCTGTAEVTVTVNPLPTITATANPNEICFGASTELTASSDITGTTFNWSGSLGAGATKTVSPTISTTYSVTGTTLEGCTGTAEVTVTVHPLPTITATATPVEICLGASAELTASSDITGTTFNWSDG
ncbi:MAG TPA: hypothetical protein GX402_05220, partial [Bacteroidales bacterium]|nr:hypothetical protein [Bacteroidales bacterium]